MRIRRQGDAMDVNSRRKHGTVKKSANLSINAGLLSQARRLGINLSQTLERRLAEMVRESRAKKRLKDNQAALKEYNDHVGRHGVFSDKLRRF
jgi:antitoxin CcdA